MMDIYREHILDHYEHPRHRGVLVDATGSAKGDNPVCGDRLSCDIRVVRGKVTDIAYDGSGCAISQAAASILSEHVLGKTVTEVARMKASDLTGLLQIELSPTRLKCGLLSLDVLQKALEAKGAPPMNTTKSAIGGSRPRRGRNVSR